MRNSNRNTPGTVNTLVIEVGAEVIPGQRLVRKLGQGGFGQVWEAISTSTGEKSALKFLDCRNQSSTLVSNEIKLLIALRELKHPHVLNFQSVTAAPGVIIMSMELADGSLTDLHYIYRSDHGTHLPPQLLLELMLQSAMALDFLSVQKLSQINSLQPQGLQHCDIKPSNLLLVGNKIRVADFGLSGPQAASERGKAMGTPPYAPPELYEGKPNSRTDQYSLAISYCELRTGQSPMPVTPDGTYPTGQPNLNILPEPERPVIQRAIQKQWLNRYSSCIEFVKELNRVIDPKTPPILSLDARPYR